ncbi:MAG: tRNA (guanosine(46)-N7)-methyltransferase TrmB [Rubrivivax sp.]
MSPTPPDAASTELPPAPALPPDTACPSARPIRSYVLRGGRIGPGQQRALDQLGPRFVLPFSAALPLDLDAAFGRHAPCVLEIGFGMGDASAAFAAARPELNLLGIEVHPPGVGALLKQVGEQGLTNVRIVQHDAVEVLQRMVRPRALAGVHIWFPDPWHKTRHHKRRLVQPALVALIADRLAPGGYLHCATDWQPYAEQMRDVLQAEPQLTAGDAGADGYAARPAWRSASKFERRGLRLGHGVWDLLAHKRER